jgi:hypothetical protein
VLRPVQAAVFFVRGGDEPLIEPLHFCNLIAMQRGILADPCLQIDAKAVHKDDVNGNSVGVSAEVAVQS